MRTRDGVARQRACVIIPADRLALLRQQRGPRLRMLRRSWRTVVPHRLVEEVRRARAANRRLQLSYRNTVLEGIADELVDEFAALRGAIRGH